MTQDPFASGIEPELHYSALFEALPGSCILLLNNAPHFTVLAATTEYLSQTGYRKDAIIGKGVFEMSPSNPHDTGDTGASDLRESLEHVRSHKVPHQLPIQRYDIAGENGTFSKRYWRAKNNPVFNHTGEVNYIIHSAEDITDEVMGSEINERMKDLEKANNLFMNAPASIGIVRGDDYVIELANEGLLQVWGQTSEVIGKPLAVAIPELGEQGFTALLDQVRTTGEPFFAYEYPVRLKRNGKEELLYFDFVYKPFYEKKTDGKAIGVISVGHDVTEQVLARQKVEEVTERLNFRNALFEAQNDTTPDGVLIIDSDGKIILYNKRFAEIWSMPQAIIDSQDDEAALEHAMTMLQDPQGFRNRVTQLYETRKEKSYDQIQFRDGRTIERYGTAISAENGKYYGWAWYFRDISERIKQEKEIEAQNILVRTITDNASSTLFLINAKGFCTFMNAAGEKMFGYTQEEITAKPLHYLIHHHRPDGSPYPKDECPLDRALPENFDVRAHKDLFFKKDGTSFPVSCAASPIFENGVPVATVIEVRDISLEVEAEQALRRGAAQLEQMVEDRTRELRMSNDQLSQFTYAASHDLQEPLRKINYFLDRLIGNLGPSLSEENKRITERLQLTAVRMRSLIEDLLAYSNTSLGATGFQEVNLGDLVREVLDDMEAVIIEKGAEVRVAALPEVMGDYRQLRQLFQNLISNALKYHKVGKAPQVLITARTAEAGEVEEPLPAQRDKVYLIEIKDNGIGFDPDDAERIFKLFQRLHGKAEYEGTGVGLAIVQKVVENHKGHIWAESEPGEGATFTVLLPTE